MEVGALVSLANMLGENPAIAASEKRGGRDWQDASFKRLPPRTHA